MLNQPNVTITETQYLQINGTIFVLTQDESGNITAANGTVTPSQSPGTVPLLRRHKVILPQPNRLLHGTLQVGVFSPLSQFSSHGDSSQCTENPLYK
jgi:hypothetical protein